MTMSYLRWSALCVNVEVSKLITRKKSEEIG